MNKFELHHGDCLDVMRGMEAGSVHCCVTSPPYYGLRDYGVEGQLGLEESPDAYVAKMVDVFKEVRRILRDDGTCWLNLGDGYASGGGIAQPHRDGCGGIGKRGTRGVQDYAASGGGFVKPDVIGNGLKPKDLIGIPWRVAFALQADGWWLRQDIIWHKPNPMPESVTDRCTKAHEYIFLLTKSAKYFYDAEAVKEENADTNRTHFARGNKTDAMRNDKGRKDFGDECNGRNRRSVWSIATKPFTGAHFAVFPPKLIEPCILAGCPDKACPHCGAGWERMVERDKPKDTGRISYDRNIGQQQRRSVPRSERDGDGGYECAKNKTLGFKPTCDCKALVHIPGTVFDPFTGSGTTGLVSIRHGRRFVGIELNPEYHTMAEGRLSAYGVVRAKTTTTPTGFVARQGVLF